MAKKYDLQLFVTGGVVRLRSLTIRKATEKLLDYRCVLTGAELTDVNLRAEAREEKKIFDEMESGKNNACRHRRI